jgi:hypothetical protein
VAGHRAPKRWFARPAGAQRPTLSTRGCFRTATAGFTHADLLSQFAEAIPAFFEDMKGAKLSNGVAVLASASSAA